MRYRRAQIKGGTYYFTLVTNNRAQFLTKSENISLLRYSFKYVKKRHPFKIDAIVIMPDHLHSIWTLPEGDNNFSKRWRLIKSNFTMKCKEKNIYVPDKSRRIKKEQAVWQRRFWEHLIRDEKDYLKHVEYIHYNPVKHGYVTAPIDWHYSSFHKFVQQGIYNKDWGADENIKFNETIGGE